MRSKLPRTDGDCARATEGTKRQARRAKNNEERIRRAILDPHVSVDAKNYQRLHWTPCSNPGPFAVNTPTGCVFWFTLRRATAAG